MTSQGGFKKKLSVPDVTKIPPEMDAHIHAIMDGISKTSLKKQRFIFSLRIKPTFIYFTSAIIKKSRFPKGVLECSERDTFPGIFTFLSVKC